MERINLMSAIPRGASNAVYGGTIARRMGIKYVAFIWLVFEAKKAGLLIFIKDANKFYVPDSLADIQRKIDECRSVIFDWQEEIDELELLKADCMECIKDRMAEIDELKRLKGESV